MKYKPNKSSIKFSSNEFEVSSGILELNRKIHCARKHKNTRKANMLVKKKKKTLVQQEEDLMIPDVSEFG